MGMSDREREIVIHTMAVALSNYLAKLLGLFFSGFFWFSLLALCSWLQMKRASKTKAHVGYKIAGAQLDFASCQLFGLLSISATTRAPPVHSPCSI